MRFRRQASGFTLLELLIAATIAWVGFVALRSRTATHGPLLAFGFGLVHGFGFAGALSDSLGEGSELSLTGLLAFSVAIIIIPVTLQMISRYTALIPAYIWTEEMARFLFIWMIMIGAMIGVFGCRDLGDQGFKSGG